MILITLLTKYSTVLPIAYCEEQDVKSTLWIEGGKGKVKLHRAAQKEYSLKRGLGGCFMDGK